MMSIASGAASRVLRASAAGSRIMVAPRCIEGCTHSLGTAVRQSFRRIDRSYELDPAHTQPSWFEQTTIRVSSRHCGYVVIQSKALSAIPYRQTAARAATITCAAPADSAVCGGAWRRLRRAANIAPHQALHTQSSPFTRSPLRNSTYSHTSLRLAYPYEMCDGSGK